VRSTRHRSRGPRPCSWSSELPPIMDMYANTVLAWRVAAAAVRDDVGHDHVHRDDLSTTHGLHHGQVVEIVSQKGSLPCLIVMVISNVWLPTPEQSRSWQRPLNGEFRVVTEQYCSRGLR